MDPAKSRFLIVEDHEFQSRMLATLLRDMQAKAVYCAADGQAALKLLEKLDEPVDVIVSDLDMPRMDGLEFIRHVAQRWPQTAVVVASVAGESVLTSVEAMAKAYGAKLLGSIPKPVTAAALRAVLNPPAERVQRSAAADAEQPFTAAEIEAALERDEIEPFFQPKIEMASGRIVGAEALARWRHPERGIVAPHLFVGELERAGDMDALMTAVLRKAARAGARWHADGHRAIRVCVNVSVQSLHDVALAERITAIVAAEQLAPGDVILEVTESTAMTHVARVLENLARLRMKGFRLSIDDYGTGYSSLEQLARVAFTELKIDQSFVANALKRESARVILASSLEMAHRLGLVAIAEGVETKATWDLLRELDCDVAQGYCIAWPMPEADFAAWIADWRGMPCTAT